MKKMVIFLVIITALAGVFFWQKNSNDSSLPVIPVPTSNIQPSTGNIPQTTVIAENLNTPWGMVFLPDKSMLVTERPGRIRLIDNMGHLQLEPITTMNQVKVIGEGGLLGITIHPLFSTNYYVYMYYTYQGSGSNTFNRVVRMTYQNNTLTNEQVIVDTIPGSSNHNGGRIKFGPDGYLYITTGDAENPSQAQNIHTLGGKILRSTDEGKPAPGNPFENLVYSYGHRNPQGLAWDNSGQLWATEHGRSGALSGLDELNRIEKGANYGWPDIQGDETKTGMETPKLHSGALTTWAPAGAVFVKNSIFFGGLRGQTLYEAVIDNDKISLKEHFKGRFGRIRDVVLGPDHMLYITTSNRDGRGNPTAEDDRIIRINPKTVAR